MTEKRSRPKMELKVPYERFLDCVHCGLCLSYCPTYVITGNEADSPRGRIHLMRSLADGKIEFTEGVKRHLDLCLGCLACETACPSGVQYHEILEAGRELTRDQRPPSLKQRFLEASLYNPDALEAAVRPMRWAGKVGLEKVARSVARKLPGGIAELVQLLPPLPPEGLRKQIPGRIEAVGERQARIGYLTGCVMSVFFSPTHLASLKVLALNGCEIYIPSGQGCCGALATHSGDRAAGRRLARDLVDRFDPLDVDAIVVNAAGCGSTMKAYGELLANDPEYSERAHRFASKVKDISELLAELPIRYPEPAEKRDGAHPQVRVTYHDACHLAHGQKVRKPPRELLEKMPGIELVDLPESDWCCGSAGTYNLTQPEIAAQLLDRKVQNILRTGAEIVVSGNPGCGLQIAHGLRAAGSSVRVMHTMDLIASAYSQSVPGIPDLPSVSGLEEH